MDLMKNLNGITVLIIFTLAISGEIGSLQAQERINSPYDDYYKYLMLQGLTESPSILWHSRSNNRWEAPDDKTSHPWGDRLDRTEISVGENSKLVFTDPELYLSANSAWAQGYNDGAIWQGKGLNGSLKAGISFESPLWQLTFDPELWFAQNLDFEIVDPSASQSDPYGYWKDELDYPQRPGSSALAKFSFGQTDLRFRYGIFTAGVSTENIVLGPAQFNPVILSANADGFPHFDIGITKWDTKIGSFEGRYLFGFLKESENYNTNPDDDWRLMTGLTGAYAPSFIPGLTIGLNWTITTPGGDFDVQNWFLTFLSMTPWHEGNTSNDDDQRLSIHFDWAFPEVGFEIYGEYGREDYPPGQYDFTAIEHTGFWVLGIKQAIPINEQRGFLISAEMASLAVSRTQNLIWSTDDIRNYYTHHMVVHGYTNNGQILGAGMGPGSDAQVININYYDNWGKANLIFQRRSIDKMYVYSDPAVNDLYNLNVEFLFGGGALFFAGKWDIEASLAATYKWNHDFIPHNLKWNVFASIETRYKY